MSRQRTNTTSETKGKQGRSFAPTTAPKQENKEEGRAVPHEKRPWRCNQRNPYTH